MIMNYLFLLLAYLCGSIPSGLLLAWTRGVDIRQAGSGNIGATNVSRLTGKGLGLVTLVADAAKAILPMLAAQWFIGKSSTPEQTEFWVALTGANAFLGHLFPVYLGFKGGKGVATALGIFLLFEPWAALISMAVFISIVFIWGYVSLGSMVAAALMPLWILLLGGSPIHVTLAVFIGLMILLKHISNIGRLWRGEENRFRK